MIEAVRTSETSVHFNVSIRQYIPEDSKLLIRRRKNLKSHIVNYYSVEWWLAAKKYAGLLFLMQAHFFPVRSRHQARTNKTAAFHRPGALTSLWAYTHKPQESKK
jgi:hypothetical protein